MSFLQAEQLRQQLAAHAARDMDVFLRTTFLETPRPGAADGLAELGRHLLGAKEEAFDRAVAAVESARYAALCLSTTAWIETGAWTGDPEPVLAHARAAPIGETAPAILDRLRHAVKRRGRHLDRLDPASRHKLRIRAKRLRYAVEFFSRLSTHPRREAEFLSILKRLQDDLGNLNDIAVARDRLLAEGALGEPDLAYAAGRAVGRREGQEGDLIASAGRHFRAFEKADPFWR